MLEQPHNLVCRPVARPAPLLDELLAHRAHRVRLPPLRRGLLGRRVAASLDGGPRRAPGLARIREPHRRIDAEAEPPLLSLRR